MHLWVTIVLGVIFGAYVMTHKKRNPELPLIVYALAFAVTSLAAGVLWTVFAFMMKAEAILSHGVWFMTMFFASGMLAELLQSRSRHRGGEERDE